MKKLLVIAENWPPRVGGIERYLINLLKALPEEFTVTVVAPPGSETDIAPNITVVSKRFFWPVIKPAWLFLYMYVLALAKKESFDAVLCGKALFEGRVAQRLKKELGIPYIVCTYGMEIHTWLNSSRTKKQLVQVLTDADRVLVINNQMQKELVDLGISASAMTKLHPGLPDEALAVPDEDRIAEIKKKYEIKGRYVFTLARLVPRKGIDDLIHAFAELEQTTYGDVQLVIAGNGPEAQELQKIADREYIRPLFLGTIPDEDIAPLMAGASIFALTPKDIDGDVEGFGIVYLEAQAAGTPILATKTGGVPEAMQEGKTATLVTPKNIKEISAALTKMLSNPVETKNMGTAGRIFVAEHFSATTQAKTLVKIIETL